MMRRTLVLASIALATVATTTAVFERDASACGGCFAPPETPTVVTDHRMILSVSKDQSTLYDQIEYSGDPQAFGWVLPISGTVGVGLSADVVFAALDQMTTTRIQAPPRNCPPPPDNCRGGFAGAASAAPEADDGVNVLKHEVVGPYETVQLESTDPAALENWLSENGFAVAPDAKPVIDQYVAEKFNFLALKLQPGKDVKDMRPVRVTTQGANVALPLRMVAAGTGATVGITLWIVGEGRYEPQNFAFFHIEDSELVWDWANNKSNYVDLRAQKTAAGQGKTWEIEGSTPVYRQNLQNVIYGGYFGNPGSPQYDQQAEQDYLPETYENGTVKKTAAQVRDEDLETLFHGIPGDTARVTRIRADLAHAALDRDLVVQASADQSELAFNRQVTQESGQPLCPVYDGCDSTGQLPRDEAIAQTNSNNGESFACATSPNPASKAWLGAGAGFLALALGSAARRRRRRL